MSGADRKWIETLVSTVTDSWDESIFLPLFRLMADDKTRPRTMSFLGSEDYIRAQFEEYILSLLSSVKYDNFLQMSTNPVHESMLPEIGTPLHRNRTYCDRRNSNQ